MLSETTLRRLRDLYPWLPTSGPAAQALTRDGVPLELDEGATVFESGQPCQAFALVLEGRVRVARPASPDSEIFLYRVTPGDVCAMTTLAALGGRPYRARAVTESAVAAVGIPTRLMLELLEDDAVRGVVVDALAGHVERLMTRLVEVSRLSVGQRLAAILCSEGPVVEATHQALADDLDCSREIVSRVLQRFQRDGLVTLGRGRIEVVNAETLGRVAAP